MNLKTIPHLPWYPLFLALVPVTRFYEANFRAFFPGDFVRISVAYLAGAGLLLLLFGRLLKDRHRAALAVAPLVIFATGGEMMGAGAAWALFGSGIGLGVALWWRKPGVARATLPLNAVFLVLLVLPVVNAWWIDRGLQPPVPTALRDQHLDVAAPAGAVKPDVWFIVMDGLGSPAWVENRFQVSRAAYSGPLRRRGFQVPDQAFANYEQTGLSLSATWNVAHVPLLLDIPDTSSRDRRVLYDLIADSRVKRAFEKLGYHTVQVPSSYPMTRWKDAGVTVEAPFAPNMVEYSLMARSMLPLVQPVFGRGPADFEYDLRRRTLKYQFANLPEARGRVPADEPALVFAHIMLPHPPFVFEQDGSPRRSEKRFEFYDGSHWLDLHGWAAGRYPEKYRAQAIYTMEQLGEAVDRILEQATRPTVIIVQGDHGPGSRLDWERPRHSDHQERFSIFNGWYLPPEYRVEIPEGMSAVNTFPVLFQVLWGAEVQGQGDARLISRWSRPYVFFETR